MNLCAQPGGPQAERRAEVDAIEDAEGGAHARIAPQAERGAEVDHVQHAEAAAEPREGPADTHNCTKQVRKIIKTWITHRLISNLPFDQKANSGT